jgi:hypothetical protein
MWILLDRKTQDAIVSFCLDLDWCGVFTVSIDGNAPYEVSLGMCQGFGEEDGFLPNVCLEMGVSGFWESLYSDF